MYLWLIPILPFCGFLINGIFGRHMSKTLVNLFAVGSVALAFAWVLKTVFGLMPLEHAYVEHYYNWIQSGAFTIGVDFAVDRLTAVMLLIVTGVGLLIHIYATGYMAHEGGYYRFFAYMNLFMFFMLVLVLGGNYLLLFVGWEGVGLCSYLLVGFYFTEQFATNAGNKAFIVNRIGDFGFTLALFLIYRQFGSLDFGAVFSKVRGLQVEATGGVLTIDRTSVAGRRLREIGADPVVCMVARRHGRSHSRFGIDPRGHDGDGGCLHDRTVGADLSARSDGDGSNRGDRCRDGILRGDHRPDAVRYQESVRLLDGFAARIHVHRSRHGRFSAGIYHLMTHAFFKALLFLGAGSVIHALSGEQDLRNMGGLRKKTPITFWTLVAASLAISGIPPFAGFYSKDEILASAYHYQPWMYWVGVITAGMTAFYVFRALFMAFFGDYRGKAHPHESPLSMTGPLMVLGLLSFIGGFTFKIPQFLEPLFPESKVPDEVWLMPVSVSAGVIGIAIAYTFYVWKPGLADSVSNAFGGLYTLVYNKYFVDEAYNAAVVQPLVQGSRTVLWRGVDVGIIDGIVNGVGSRSKGVGGILKLMQGGNVRAYAAWVVFGCVLLLLAIGFGGGVR